MDNALPVFTLRVCKLVVELLSTFVDAQSMTTLSSTARRRGPIAARQWLRVLWGTTITHPGVSAAPQASGERKGEGSGPGLVGTRGGTRGRRPAECGTRYVDDSGRPRLRENETGDGDVGTANSAGFTSTPTTPTSPPPPLPATRPAQHGAAGAAEWAG